MIDDATKKEDRLDGEAKSSPNLLMLREITYAQAKPRCDETRHQHTSKGAAPGSPANPLRLLLGHVYPSYAEALQIADEEHGDVDVVVH
eukprot:CAMPEP_0170636946 /NCGR_PEP_ID=MMETSP0224-20130122/38118_1 /TAXON_ID=285029 /ORGANISM="Togula jolla, Strain CCCM 725" /LENGTH=88 /DNA_ID=CAMNT_0010966731 /DNA_START=317 /DNA_END=581 /DNA_ORIENTATION=+